MEFEQEIQRSIGFRNEALADKLRNVDLKHLPDELLCKIGIVMALSKKEENNDVARTIQKMLVNKHDHSGPFQLIKWLLKLTQGYDRDNLAGQLIDWSDHHSDDILYSRVILYVHDNNDPIEQIGAYVRHLEIFYDDTLAWIELGHLYMKEKLYDRAAFAYEEAISFVDDDSSFYVYAAEARSNMDGDDNKSIARKQLSKAILLDEKNMKAVDMLIELGGPNTEKLIQYRKLMNSK
ncbi:hypothetical protein TVAG_291670 [Trichomonas vaginalis G3]|uniref:ER membrane protein complex subunit 2 n=1 Tax=Trichomonas vaginalis (strain ATCC PRA-98 / G3) TaxID=412133 RepID=A2DQU8_TRIV3|nr:ER membrane protein complex subunit 2 family [Trichomonas vaginalis G3]EAY17215.1 hypothetical protein TVAG_291670 [Trichomonas vaginalis G3]KAI5486253.1 ER membrane protein complex subunit 2 family [Trichomonas vaginalis G3]|eukprot:XP_001329438.1 hypothetical protein [Trichomonas vaginalis G3]